MQKALRISKLDSNNQAIVHIDFLEYEVLECAPVPFRENRIDRAQTGKPTQFIFGDADWHIIPITIRIHDETTAGKINTIKNGVKDGSLYRVHPNYIDDPGLFFDCFIPVDYPVGYFFSGRYAVATEQLVFYEASKESQVSMAEFLLTS